MSVEDRRLPEAERPEDGDLGDPLARGHRHRVRRDEEDDEDDDRARSTVTTAFTFPSIETKPFWNSFSVSVFVGKEEFSNIASICAGNSLRPPRASRP